MVVAGQPRGADIRGDGPAPAARARDGHRRALHVPERNRHCRRVALDRAIRDRDRQHQRKWRAGGRNRLEPAVSHLSSDTGIGRGIDPVAVQVEISQRGQAEKRYPPAGCATGSWTGRAFSARSGRQRYPPAGSPSACWLFGAMPAQSGRKRYPPAGCATACCLPDRAVPARSGRKRYPPAGCPTACCLPGRAVSARSGRKRYPRAGAPTGCCSGRAVSARSGHRDRPISAR